jgi:radical SAM superfamily enzyme with C-terminal helix-hairpin-helix motif
MSRAQERIERAAKRNLNVHKNTTNKNAKPLKQKVALQLHKAICNLYPELHLREYDAFNSQTPTKYNNEADRIIRVIRRDDEEKRKSEQTTVQIGDTIVPIWK